MKFSYDPKCFELAEHFTKELPNTELTKEFRRRLAQSIQDSIQEHCYAMLEPQTDGESSGG